MFLVLDTETTGFPRTELPPDHPDQARICQLAWVLLDDKFEERSCFKSLIKPDGWRISEGAQKAHGISQEECEKWGIGIEDVYALFHNANSHAKRVIAHNLRFDEQLGNIEQQRLYKTEFSVDGKGFCTMEAMTLVCKLPGKYNGQFKWPKLSEAYRYVTGQELVGAHDALVDVRACATVFKWLFEQGLVK